MKSKLIIRQQSLPNFLTYQGILQPIPLRKSPILLANKGYAKL